MRWPSSGSDRWRMWGTSTLWEKARLHGTGKQRRRGNRKGIRDGLTESVTPGRYWLGSGVFLYIYILGKNTAGH